jgi:hypothetical protein
LAIVGLAGYFGMKRPMFLLVALYATLVSLIEFSGVPVSHGYATFEAAMFLALVYCLYHRPEWIPSDPPTADTVQIGFYYGEKSPIAAHIMALLGMPATGIAIVIGKEAMVPIGKTGKMELRNRDALRKWCIIDTDQEPSEESMFEFYALEGVDVGACGCMKAASYFLDSLGADLSATRNPSSYMEKVLARR